jgi:hypothetical protein
MWANSSKVRECKAGVYHTRDRTACGPIAGGTSENDQAATFPEVYETKGKLVVHECFTTHHNPPQVREAEGVGESFILRFSLGLGLMFSWIVQLCLWYANQLFNDDYSDSDMDCDMLIGSRQQQPERGVCKDGGGNPSSNKRGAQGGMARRRRERGMSKISPPRPPKKLFKSWNG